MLKSRSMRQAFGGRKTWRLLFLARALCRMRRDGVVALLKYPTVTAFVSLPNNCRLA